MKIIWYNPDQQTYKCGSAEDLTHELVNAKNSDSYTVLMKFDKSSNRMASEVLKQLNILNATTNLPMVFWD